MWLQTYLISFCLTFMRFTNIAFFTNRSKEQPCIEQAYRHHFSSVHSLRVSVSHIGKFLQCFTLFHYHYIHDGDPWSVIFGVTVVTVLGHQELHPHKTVKLTNKCYIVWLLHQPAILPSFSLFSSLLKWGQLITLKWPLGVQVKGRITHLSL